MERYKEIHLFKGRGIAKVSVKDYERVRKYSWALGAGKYAVASFDKGKRRVYLHRFVLGVTDPKIQVDHRSRDTLDCRRSKLRLCTNAQNQMNRRACAASGYKGVHYFPRNKSNPWMATIHLKGRSKHLGYFVSAKAAAWAYDQAAIKLFGKFALLNKVPRPTLLRNPNPNTGGRLKGGAYKYANVVTSSSGKL